MSFILDALQKDQVEQSAQPIPNGMLPPVPPASPIKRWGLWLLGAALLINAVLLGWYLLTQNSGSSSAPQVAPSLPGAKRELSMAPTPRPQTDTTPIASTPRSLPKRTPVRTPSRTPIAAPTRTRQPKVAPTPSTAKANPPAGGSGRVLSPEQAAQMGIGNELLSTEETKSAQPAAQPTRTATANEPAPAPRNPNAITVAELPTAARNSFPELEFSTHIFADDPSMRAVVVNDKRLVEGEQLGELILRAVTEEGVVFGYRNHQVAVSVVELWAE